MNALQLSIIGIALLALIVSALVVHGMLKRALKKRDKETLLMLWAHAKSQKNATLKVVEADKVLDEALRMLGFTGTLGDKLKSAGPRFKDLNGVWAAHKLRNSLVHDLQIHVSEGDISRAMWQYEQALLDLGL